MPSNSRFAKKPGDALSVLDAAKWLGVKPGTLDNWRFLKTGPAYVRVGRTIRYHESDLIAFIEKSTARTAA